jgi:hypothetical protein
MNKTNNHPLKMPQSTGTVCTPYDSRMRSQRAELMSLIVSRTKRQLKTRLATY